MLQSIRRRSRRRGAEKGVPTLAHLCPTRNVAYRTVNCIVLYCTVRSGIGLCSRIQVGGSEQDNIRSLPVAERDRTVRFLRVSDTAGGCLSPQPGFPRSSVALISAGQIGGWARNRRQSWGLDDAIIQSIKQASKQAIRITLMVRGSFCAGMGQTTR